MELIDIDDAKRLWLCVLIQLMEDYVRPNPIAGNLEEGKAAKTNAISWIEGNSRDYKLVCEYAAVDSNRLRNTILTANSKELHAIIKQYRKAIKPS